MWQRVQTVFLGIAILALLASMVLPIWMIEVNGEKVVLTSFYLMKQSAGENGTAEVYSYIPYSVTAVVCIAAITLAFIEITKYRNRMTQMKIGALNSFFLVAVILSSFYFSTELMKSLNAGGGEYGLGMWIPGVAVLCNLLANRFIRKDEKLVRDSNRLR